MSTETPGDGQGDNFRDRMTRMVRNTPSYKAMHNTIGSILEVHGLSGSADEIRKAARDLPAEDRGRIESMLNHLIEDSGKQARKSLAWGFVLGLVGNFLVSFIFWLMG